MASPDGLDQRYWDGLNDEQIYLQRCTDCGGWQWGPSGYATVA